MRRNTLLLLVNSFVIRDLLRNRVRTILTVIGIALGVAVMLAINLANSTTLDRFRESINLVAGKANLQIAPVAGLELPEQELAKLQFLWDEDIPFTPIIDQLAGVDGAAPDVVQVLGVDSFSDPRFRAFSYTTANGPGSFNDIFESNATYVGERFAAKHNLKTGSTFKMLTGDKEKEFRVAGIINYSGPGKTFGGNLIVMDIGPAQQAFDMNGRLSRIDIIAPDDKIEAIRDRIKAVLSPNLAAERPQRRGEQVQKMLAAFQYNLAALSLIALLVGVFVIYNTMSITVLRKRSEIGVLRTIGASRRRIFAMFTIQALILGVIGSAVGVGAGLVFAGGAVRAVGSTVQQLYVDQPPADVSYGWEALAVAFAFGILMTLVAAMAPVWEAMSVAPAEATRRASYERRFAGAAPRLALFGLALILVAGAAAMAPAVGGFPIFGYISAALCIFGVAFCMPILLARLIAASQTIIGNVLGSEGKLAIVSLGGTIGRTSVTVASLMLGIAMMVSLAIMIGSFRETVIVWVNQSLQADLYIESQARNISSRAGRLSHETVESIRHVAGVEDVDAFVDVPIEYHGAPTNLGAGDLEVLMKHGRLMMLGDKRSEDVFKQLTERDSAVVTESFSLRYNVKDGDTITLPSPSGPFTVKVAGVYYDYASDLGYVIIPRALYRQKYSDSYSTTLGVYLAPNASADAVRASIVKELGVDTKLNVRTNGELRREVLRVFDNTFAITYALHAISILVAILGVMNALFALTFELKREFAILSFVGASKQQIKKIIYVQAATLGLLGNTAGVIVGFVLSLLLIHVINKQSFGWTVQVSIPVQFLLQSFGLIMLFSLLSGWLPARAAVRNISPEAVRIE